MSCDRGCCPSQLCKNGVTMLMDAASTIHCGFVKRIPERGVGCLVFCAMDDEKAGRFKAEC